MPPVFRAGHVAQKRAWRFRARTVQLAYLDVLPQCGSAYPISASSAPGWIWRADFGGEQGKLDRRARYHIANASTVIAEVDAAVRRRGFKTVGTETKLYEAISVRRQGFRAS
jgi:hypothetical protein